MTRARRRAFGVGALSIAGYSVLFLCAPNVWRSASASPIARNADPAQCSISVASPAFARYDSLDDVPTKGQGGIDVTCSRTNVNTIAIAASSGASLDPSRRFMRGRSGAESLRYALYLDTRSDRLWGDGTRGTSLLRLAVAAGLRSASQPIFGVIPPHQNVSPGAYHDELTITVVF